MKQSKSSIKQKQMIEPGEIEQAIALLIGDDYENNEEIMIPYKCIDCGYEEGVPEWLIEEMEGAKDLLTNPDNYLDMECPECNGTMKPIKY